MLGGDTETCGIPPFVLIFVKLEIGVTKFPSDETEELRRDLEKGFREWRDGLALRGAKMGDCRGVDAREFHTPSTSGSSIMAFAPKGISSLDLTVSLISALSISSSVETFDSFRNFRSLCNLTTAATPRTRTFDDN